MSSTIAAFPTEEHRRMIDTLLADTRANGGLAPLDIGQFWADQAVAIANPFGKDIPQLPLGMQMSSECIFDELGIEEDFWRLLYDESWRLEMCKAYNDIAEPIVGRRLLSEQPGPAPHLRYPQIKWLHDVFEAENIWHNGSWWLQQSAHDEDGLQALLDRVEARDIRSFILPENWDEEKARLLALGVKPPLYRGQRGPITFATSIFGIENLIYLLADNEELAARFRDTILRTMLEIGRVLDEEAGYTPETAPHGFGFADDNCYLMTPEWYEFFGYPILYRIFERYSPNPGDSRHQHSDSAMGHLLPLLGKLGLTSTNFGPTVMADEIREHLPNAVIYGEMAPFTLSRNDEEQILVELLRDFAMTKATRGLVFSCAGSINNGSRLTSMRLIMAAIQRYCRYDG
ncbi:MAG: uroporphyrinogen decarboxylase family protein [Armatimonadota bacterium]